MNMFDKCANETVENVLIIRSSSNLFPIVIDELRRQYTGLKISCLIPKGAELGETRNDMHDVFETAHQGGFKWRDIMAFRQIVKNKFYDIVIILYNSNKGLSYLNIDTFAMVAPHRKCLIVNMNKDVILLSPWQYAGKIIRRLYDCLWVAVNSISTAVVCGAILLGMFITAPIIFIKKHMKK